MDHNDSHDRHTILTLSGLTAQGKCWIDLQPGAIRVLFDPSHPKAKRGYAIVSGALIMYSNDENGVELPWARIKREQGPQPSRLPCRNHDKPGCTADGCF